jgi:Major Facilitator Superfamily
VKGLVTGVGEGVVATLAAPFVRHVLHGSSKEFGLFLAAQAIGGIAGGALAVWIGPRAPAARLLTCGAVAVGVMDLAIFLYPLGYNAAWPAVLGIVLVGLPVALTMAGLMTLYQQNAPDSHLGRVFGAYAATQGIAMLAGTLAGGLRATTRRHRRHLRAGRRLPDSRPGNGGVATRQPSSRHSRRNGNGNDAKPGCQVERWRSRRVPPLQRLPRRAPDHTGRRAAR